MTSSLDRLISAGSPSLSHSIQSAEDISRDSLSNVLASILENKNGFYAFESALLVRPSQAPSASVLDIQSWNSWDLWREAYGETVAGITFFAEDIFGCQFGVRQESVVSFNPETGEIE